MFKMYASNSNSYTRLILAMGIVRKPTVWGVITSEYPGIHDIGLPVDTPLLVRARTRLLGSAQHGHFAGAFRATTRKSDFKAKRRESGNLQ